MDATNRAKAILKLLGYTPQKLAQDINVSVYRAKKILSEDGIVYWGEFEKICSLTMGNIQSWLYNGCAV